MTNKIDTVEGKKKKVKSSAKASLLKILFEGKDKMDEAPHKYMVIIFKYITP